MAESWNDLNEVSMAIQVEAGRMEHMADLAMDQAEGKASYGESMTCEPIRDEEALKFLRRMAGVMIAYAATMRKLQELADFAVMSDEVSWRN